LLNGAFAMAILDLISRVHLASFVIMLPKYLKYFTFSSCFYAPLAHTFCVAVKMLHVLCHTPVFFRMFACPKP
jgi:hypothetical protein